MLHYHLTSTSLNKSLSELTERLFKPNITATGLYPHYDQGSHIVVRYHRPPVGGLTTLFGVIFNATIKLNACITILYLPSTFLNKKSLSELTERLF